MFDKGKEKLIAASDQSIVRLRPKYYIGSSGVGNVHVLISITRDNKISIPRERKTWRASVVSCEHS